MSSREDIIDGLYDVCSAISGVKTVSVGLSDVDMTVIPKGSLPYIQIVPYREEPTYETSLHALWMLNCVLTCYMLSDIGETADVEDMIKDIKDAIGKNPTLGGTCIIAEINSVEVAGEFPMWRLVFLITCKYEKGIEDA